VLKREIAFNLLLKIAALAVSLISTPVMLSFFSDSEVLGAWFTILSFLNWIAFFDFGIGNGLRNDLTYALNKKASKVREIVSSSYFVLSVVAFVLILICIPLIRLMDWNGVFSIAESKVSSSVLKTCMTIVVIGTVFQLILKLSNSVLYSFQKNVMPSALLLIGNVLILFALLAPIDFSLGGKLIYISAIQVGLTALPFFAITIKLFLVDLKQYHVGLQAINIKYFSRIGSLGILFFITQISLLLISSTNELLIGLTCGSESVTSYSVTFRIFNLVLVFFSVLAQPVWSRMAEAYAVGSIVKLTNMQKKYLNASFLAIGIAILISALLNPILMVWLGDQAPDVSAFQSFSLCLMVSATVVLNATTCLGNATNRLIPQAVFLTLGALVKIPLSYFLSSILGTWECVVLANAISLLPAITAQSISNRYFIASWRTKAVGE
jgi:O-antigen/teichoic acid export membrane protein